MTAFTSDPMDTPGLRSYEFYFKELYDSYFRINKAEKIDTETGEIVETKRFESNDNFYQFFRPFSKKHGFLQTENQQIWKINKGLVKHFADLNNAMFSRNYKVGRAHNEQEVRDKLDFLKTELPNNEDYTNIMSKQGRLLSQTGRWSDNILNKIDIPKLKDMYREMNTLAKRFKMEYGGDAWIRKIWGRGTFTIKQNLYVDRVLNEKYRVYEGGITKDEKTGRYISNLSLAFIMGRAIKRDGIQGLSFFQKPLGLGLQQFGGEMLEAVAEDIIDTVNKTTKTTVN